ncbi:putative BRCT domain-containing protein [Rosa chinensis]|uniref:Putative BRCT domain-containing protein n=1 Tax=Rosa chinensis TaxID=74649 RepID=A0A2P6PZN3_ROSCH|nr:putative BRCT domain-containing protein [Rosa chinensis]
MGGVEVIKSKGCSRLSGGLSSPLPSFKVQKTFGPMSPAANSIGSETVVRSNAPFSGLVICVTGLSKEARKQVMEATERLGGQYSPHLHPQCTHLVCYSFGGRKFEHALKHGSRNGLSIVTIGWFVDSVRKNVRLSESLYSIRSLGQNGIRLDELNRLVGFSGTENSCLPVAAHGTKQLSTIEEPQFSGRESNCNRSSDSTLSGHSMYVDLDISAELRNKVIQAASREGATFLDQWFVGCRASHVVCEGSSSRKYLGHSSNIVTPLWVLKTVKEKYVQRLVYMSADLARQVGMILEDLQNGNADEETTEQNVPEDAQTYRNIANLEKRQKIVNSAKTGVRNRRGLRMQTCQTPMRPITPSSLLDSICWSISEPTSAASIYTETFSSEDVGEHQTSVFFDAKGDGKESEASFANLTRPLKESEKSELIFKNHFLTILFPIDRFAEMGPSSRTFFSNDGFTCLQVLDHIYAYYQESMSVHEIEAAIHTDSKHADRLRSVYASKETAERGYAIFKRIDFLGSRRSFEMLKRVNGDNNSNVYELLIRA